MREGSRHASAMEGANPAYHAARLRLLLEAEGGDKRMGLEDWKAKQEDDAKARMDQVRSAGAPRHAPRRSHTRAGMAPLALRCGRASRAYVYMCNVGAAFESQAPPRALQRDTVCELQASGI